MASRGNIVDEVTQQAEATNQNEGVQVAGAGSQGDIRHRWEDNIKMDLQEVGWVHQLVLQAQDRREITNQESHGVLSRAYGTCQWLYKKCQWREHQSDAAEVRNQNESPGLMSRACDKLHQWRSRPVSQCSYVDRDPNVTSYKTIYKSIIERSTIKPYTFKFHDPAHIITGIACLPKDAETSSPETTIVAGGVGCKEVEIMLTPVEEGYWACRVQIIGIEDSCVEMGSDPKQLTM